jgi:hypothetical protein
MRLIVYLIVAVVAFLIPPFIFYFFIHDSGWEIVLRVGSFFYFITFGLFVQRYRRAAEISFCLVNGLLSIIALFSFPFVFEYAYDSNLNLNNSFAIETWSIWCNVSFLSIQILAILYFRQRFRTEYKKAN